MHDHAHLERLYDLHARTVHAYVRRRADPATADDVVSEVFLVAWRRRHELPDEPLPWLIGVARKTLTNHRRTASRSAALHLRLGETLSAAHDLGNVDAPDHAALEALAALPDRDREILLLLAWEGLTQTEIAHALGINRPAVAARLMRARRRLARLLERDAAELSRIEPADTQRRTTR